MATKSKEPTYFPVLVRWETLLNKLSDSEAGIILKAMYQYRLHGTDPVFDDGKLDIFWCDVQNWLDTSTAKYETKVKQTSAAGKKSAENKAKSTDVNNRQRTLTKEKAKAKSKANTKEKSKSNQNQEDSDDDYDYDDFPCPPSTNWRTNPIMHLNKTQMLETMFMFMGMKLNYDDKKQAERIINNYNYFDIEIAITMIKGNKLSIDGIQKILKSEPCFNSTGETDGERIEREAYEHRMSETDYQTHFREEQENAVPYLLQVMKYSMKEPTVSDKIKLKEILHLYYWDDVQNAILKAQEYEAKSIEYVKKILKSEFDIIDDKYSLSYGNYLENIERQMPQDKSNTFPVPRDWQCEAMGIGLC